MVRQFVRDEVVPLEDHLDADDSHLAQPDLDKLVARVQQMGLYNIDMPEDAGGPGLDTFTRSLIAIETSQHRAGLYSPCYGAFGPPALAGLSEGTDDQKERYLW